MKKSEFWKYNWIHITKRLPPHKKGVFVLIWNPEAKEPIAMESYIARSAGVGILAKEFVSKDRYYTEWCLIVPPEKKKRRRTK